VPTANVFSQQHLMNTLLSIVRCDLYSTLSSNIYHDCTNPRPKIQASPSEACSVTLTDARAPFASKSVAQRARHAPKSFYFLLCKNFLICPSNHGNHRQPLPISLFFMLPTCAQTMDPVVFEASPLATYLEGTNVPEPSTHPQLAPTLISYDRRRRTRQGLGVRRG
jgi:hypothetical protein